MLTLFWDMEGALLVHFTPEDETVNSQTIVMCYERN
jgi:hypothetical protein